LQQPRARNFELNSGDNFASTISISNLAPGAKAPLSRRVVFKKKPRLPRRSASAAAEIEHSRA
jgi:hypothetical protein